MAQGPGGEIAVWYPGESTYQFWNWEQATSFVKGKDADGKYFVSAEPSDVSFRGDALRLKSSYVAEGRKVLAMQFMKCADATVFLSLYRKDSEYALEVRFESASKTYKLPPQMVNNLLLKASDLHVIVASSDGYLYVLKYNAETQELRDCSGLLNVLEHCSKPVVQAVDRNPDELIFKTATFDGAPVYDIMGNWLVYSPTKLEHDHYKQLVASNEDKVKKLVRSVYTAVRLPPAGPLLNRVVSLISNSALDKLFKLSELSSKKVRGYLTKSDKNKIMDKDVSLHLISTTIGNALYSTANKIKKLAMSVGENEIIKVVDLSNGLVMATFKPPGGVSHLSLNPYDLQLVHANYRGDNFYMWDLYKLPKEVSLIGKFVRGKTSASIKEMTWFVNKTDNSLKGTNFGFGCITKRSGSVHWYNINYLVCGNENNNYPNVLNGSGSKEDHSQFLDSWILPSIGAVKFFKLPWCSNVPSSINQTKHTSNEHDFFRINQLAFLDLHNNLRLVSPLNGKHTFKYILPEQPVEDLPVVPGGARGYWNPAMKLKGWQETREFDAPLSQTEIETCTPYLRLIDRKNIEFATYDLDDSADAFLELFEDFGNEVPIRSFDFRGDSGPNTPLVNSQEDLMLKFAEGLVINPESYEDV